MKRLILGSQSATRKKLFDGLGIPFEVIPANINEKEIRDPVLEKQTELIARKKAEALLEKYPDAVIITADTVMRCEGKLLEKPESLEEASAMIRLMSHQWAEVLTGYCYIDSAAGIHQSGLEINRYLFREIDNDEIARYVAAFPVLTWSGAFVPGYAYPDSFILEARGSHTSSMYGLPAEHIIPLLKKSGLSFNPVFSG